MMLTTIMMMVTVATTTENRNRFKLETNNEMKRRIQHGK